MESYKKNCNEKSKTTEDKEYIVRKFVSSVKQTSNDEVKDIYEALAQAKSDWELAEQYFNLLDNPQLIDYAIYNQKACEERYGYLLKKAKEMKLINQNESVICTSE